MRATESMRVDRNLLLKYQGAAPRYTSYPPANRFKSEFEPARASGRALQVAASEGPASVYLHLPFCHSQCWYCGCHTIVTRETGSAARYLTYLEKELDLLFGRRRDRKRVGQIHFGGGTPNFLTADEILQLGDLLGRYLELEPDCEFGVELDPRFLAADHVRALRKIGCNRASIGIQDVDPAVQIAIHRWQPEHLNTQAVGWLRGSGFRSINVDLISGLPAQTVASFDRTLDSVLGLNPDRLSIFTYAHVPWLKPAQAIFERRGQLSSADLRLSLFCSIYDRVMSSGYVDIGLDHFAKPNDDLAVAQRDGRLQRNFQGYSTSAGLDLIGLGISAISSDPGSYRQNCKNLQEWEGALDGGCLPIERATFLKPEDVVRRSAIMHIMCDRSLDYAALSSELGIDARAHFADEIGGLDDLEKDGVLARTESGLQVLPAGMPLLRVVAMRFDPTLSPQAPRRHSPAF